MTQQDPIAVLRQFMPQASQITGTVEAGQNILTRGLNQDLLRQQNKQAEIQTQNLTSEQNITNTVNRLQEVERMIGFGASPEQIAGKLQGYIQESQATGGDPIDSQQALQVLQQGGIPALQEVLGQAKQVFQQQGLMKAPAQASTAGLFTKIDPSKFTPESVAMFESTGKFSDLVPVAGQVDDPAFISELRKELRSETGTLQKQASTLKSNYEKLTNLTSEINKGNRTAVAQALVSLVKLGDPTSVVKDSEMEAALNAENPLAAIGSILKNTDAETAGVVQSFVRKIDPLSPDTVNTDELLSTANAMLSPNVGTILGAYDLAKSRGKERLSEGGFSSIFGQERDDLFSSLRDLSPRGTETLTSPSGIKYTVK